MLIKYFFIIAYNDCYNNYYYLLKNKSIVIISVERMVYLTNPVEDYFTANPNMKLSIESLAKKLDLKKRQVVYLVHHSKQIRQIHPFEVGSGKHTLGVYTLETNE